MLLISSPGTVTTKSRLIFPFLSATCLLLATTVISASSIWVMYSPVTLSLAASVTICCSPLSSVQVICWGGRYPVSVTASLVRGWEMRTRFRRCCVAVQETSSPAASARGTMCLVFLIAAEG